MSLGPASSQIACKILTGKLVLWWPRGKRERAQIGLLGGPHGVVPIAPNVARRIADALRNNADRIDQLLGRAHSLRPLKNAAAVELGRRGGKVKGRKGLAAMTPEQRKRIQSKGGKNRWKGKN